MSNHVSTKTNEVASFKMLHQVLIEISKKSLKVEPFFSTMASSCIGSASAMAKNLAVS